MYCRRCSYNLKQLDTPRCPECGRSFDPMNPATYRKTPSRIGHRVKWVMKIVVFFVIILLILSFLPIWPATARHDSWRTTLWLSDHFVHYD